jgi:DNA-binding MarR family transcriptional regulator
VPERQWFPEAALLQELYSAGVLAGVLVDRELELAGISPQHFSFLGWIAALEPVTPGALAAETGMPPTTIRDYVRALVGRGDVRKVPNPGDGRSYLLELTPQGRSRMDSGHPSVRAAYAWLEAQLVRPPDEYLECASELREALREALAEHPVTATRSRPE